MTVRELIALLQEQPDQDKKVVIWVDEDFVDPFYNADYMQAQNPDLLVI